MMISQWLEALEGTFFFPTVPFGHSVQNQPSNKVETGLELGKNDQLDRKVDVSFHHLFICYEIKKYLFLSF